ncbi:MAG: helix-turn-helix transcriptional regulator [Catenulispora sp.]|nr:helix-turn-helix transcriptional regulator [Catenulispora sp.]
MHIDDEAGARIRALRLARGRSQADLTGPGLSAPYLSLIESGARRPSATVLRRLAGLLGTTAEQLAHGADPAPDAWREAERRIVFAELAITHASAAEALAELDELAGLAGMSGASGASGSSGASGLDEPAELGPDFPAPLRDRADLVRAKALEVLDRRMEALAVYEELERRAEPGSAVWAERCVDMMRQYSRLGDLASSIEFGERALTAFEALGLEWTTEAVRLGVTLSGKYWKRGDLARARRLIERMLTAAESVGSPLARGSALWNAAGIALTQGRRDDAVLLAGRAVALLGEAEHLTNVALMRYFYAYILFMTGADDDTIRTRNAEARSMLHEVGGPVDRARCEVLEAELDLRGGDAQAAATRADEALALVRSAAVRNPEVEARAHASRARALHALDQSADATAELETAETALAAADQSVDVVEVWQRIADTWEQFGRPDRSIQAYRQALTAAGHAPAAVPEPAAAPPRR